MLRPLALPAALIYIVNFYVAEGYYGGSQNAFDEDQTLGSKSACPEYGQYSMSRHAPFSSGPLKLPFQRPAPRCRTFTSLAVESIIEDITSRMKNPDLARLFENAMPNTLDTTVAWHKDGLEDQHTDLKARRGATTWGKWDGPQSFIVTGDINASWLRDSTNQVSHFLPLAKKDTKIYNLILGLINTQAEMVQESPYCNAFQPPPPSLLPLAQNGLSDDVHPAFEPSAVFECKYELDSLSSFLALSNAFHEYTDSTDYMTPRWYKALDNVLEVIDKQSQSTFDPITGRFQKNVYTFQRKTDQSSETLLWGIGNPINNGSGLVRSAFRPSDDATVFPLLIPSNAMMAVELKRTAKIVRSVGNSNLGKTLENIGESITNGIWESGVFKHRIYGDVFAYEVDNFGGQIVMDDANLPSLLSLPLLGFLTVDNPVYQNTRRMLLSKNSNPFYLKGGEFQGIGGPHIGYEFAWPMSLLVQISTSSDDDEIMHCLALVLNSSRLGLVHESVKVENVNQWTRSWFAWANSFFGRTILDLAERKPHLLFGDGAEPFVIM